VIVQPQLDVPAKIAAGLANGSYVLIGGVVRNAANGRLVALLKEASGSASSQSALGRSAAVLRSRPAAALAGALGAATAGAVTHVVVKKRKQAQLRALPQCVVHVSASIQKYLDAGRSGSLDASVITRLINDLDAMEAYAISNDVALELPNEPWEGLVKLVAGHTPRLAVAYSVDLAGLPASESASGDANVALLRRHLDVQRRVLALSPPAIESPHEPGAPTE
jgi:hypothetical protein